MILRGSEWTDSIASAVAADTFTLGGERVKEDKEVEGEFKSAMILSIFI